MKRGDLIQVKIEDVRFPNTGIGFIDGYRVVVKNAMLGQVVEVRIKRKRKDSIDGKFYQVIKKADSITISNSLGA